MDILIAIVTATIATLLFWAGVLVVCLMMVMVYTAWTLYRLCKQP